MRGAARGVFLLAALASLRPASGQPPAPPQGGAPQAAPSQDAGTPPWAGHGKPVLCAAFSPDGRQIVSGDGQGMLFHWEAATGRNIAAWNAYELPVTALAFSPDGRRIVTGGADGNVKVWAERKLLGEFTAHQHPILALALSPNGRYLATVSRDAQRRLWDTTSGAMVSQWRKRDESPVVSVAYLPDKRNILFGSDDGTIRICEARGAEEAAGACDVYSLEGCGRTAPLPDGKYALSACQNGDLLRWDLATGKQRVVAKGFGTRINALAVSPDGKLAVSGGDDELVRLWDLEGMRHVAAWRGHKGPVWTVAFSPDGKTVLSGGDDRVLHVWEVAGELECAQRFASARQLLDAGKPADAVKPFEEAAACRPGNLEYLNWLGSVYSDLGQHAKAVETLQKVARQSKPDSWQYYLARSLMALGNLTEARQTLADAANEPLSNNRGVDHRGEVRTLLDKVDAYRQLLDRASTHLQGGLFAEAQAELESALAQIESAEARGLLDDAKRRLAAQQKSARRKLMVTAAVAAACLLGGLVAFQRYRKKMKAMKEDLDGPAGGQGPPPAR